MTVFGTGLGCGRGDLAWWWERWTENRALDHCTGFGFYSRDNVTKEGKRRRKLRGMCQTQRAQGDFNPAVMDRGRSSRGRLVHTCLNLVPLSDLYDQHRSLRKLPIEVSVTSVD